MKEFVIVGALLLSGSALAESQLEVRVNRIDMAVTAPDDSDDAVQKNELLETTVKKTESVNSSASAATDYNSSRSNRALAHDSDDDDDGLDSRVCADGVDDDCDAPRDADPANHNSTRSK